MSKIKVLMPEDALNYVFRLIEIGKESLADLCLYFHQSNNMVKSFDFSVSGGPDDIRSLLEIKNTLESAKYFGYRYGNPDLNAISAIIIESRITKADIRVLSKSIKSILDFPEDIFEFLKCLVIKRDYSEDVAASSEKKPRILRLGIRKGLPELKEKTVLVLEEAEIRTLSQLKNFSYTELVKMLGKIMSNKILRLMESKGYIEKGSPIISDDRRLKKSRRYAPRSKK